jgi:Mg2+ and Co2+ transporter CorA
MLGLEAATIDAVIKLAEKYGLELVALLTFSFIALKASGQLVLQLLKIVREKLSADQEEIRKNRELLEKLLTNHMAHLQESQEAFMKYQNETTKIQEGMLAKLDVLHDAAKTQNDHQQSEVEIHNQLQNDLNLIKDRLDRQ